MWSYDPTNLDDSTDSGRLNVVRLLVGDTDTLDQQVQNEEIEFSLTVSSNNVYGAGAWVARYLSAKYSRFVDTDLDGQLAESYSQLREHYSLLANTLEAEKDNSSVSLGVSAGGISKSEMERVEGIPDRVAPYFRRDSYKYPESYKDYSKWE